MNDLYYDEGIKILEDNEAFNPLYGMEAYLITQDMINSLLIGKRLYIAVNDEYAVILKLGKIAPDRQSLDVQMAYYKGVSDGIDKCAATIKRLVEGRD